VKADQVEVSKAAIQQYENGSSIPSNHILKRIAGALGVDFWEFFRIPQFNISIESVKFKKDCIIYCQKLFRIRINFRDEN